MRSPRFTRYPLAAALSLALAACGGSGNDSVHGGLMPKSAAIPPQGTPVSLTLQKIGSTPAAGLAASEINAYDPDSKRLFVANGALGTVEVFDLSDPNSPTLLQSIAVEDIGSAINSVAVHDGLVALAVESSPKTSPGAVAFYDAASLERLAVVPVGAQPDMLVFSANGAYLLTANEGEPSSYGQPDSVDPEGSISVIAVTRRGKRVEPTVRTADFRAFNDQAASLRAQGVRIYGPGASVAQDLEPEYIALDGAGRLAYVTLQENNAIATVDIAQARVLEIRALGLKDHSQAGNGFDPSDEDSATDSNSGSAAIKIGNWPVQGMYLPDGIAAYESRGQTYLVTANEGDARADWPGFNEEVRIRAWCDKGLDPTVFPGATGDASDRLLKDSNLGRLRITTSPNGNDNGKNAAGQCNKLWSYGGRSFSIWRASDLARVYDSGDELERRIAEISMQADAPLRFNASHDNNTLDARSPAKGPEPESVTLGQIGSRTFAFVGLERVGGVMVYDVSDPINVAFETYVNTRHGLSGDLGPEGLSFVPANRSPNGQPMLLVSNEVSGTTAVFQVNVEKGPKRR